MFLHPKTVLTAALLFALLVLASVVFVPTVYAANTYAAVTAGEDMGVGQISFTGGQVIAGAAVLISGITALFWLLLAAKDSQIVATTTSKDLQLRELNEQIKQSYANLATERADAALATTRLLDYLGGALKSNEIAANKNTDALQQLVAITSTEHAEIVSVLRDLAGQTTYATREHRSSIRAPKVVG